MADGWLVPAVDSACVCRNSSLLLSVLTTAAVCKTEHPVNNNATGAKKESMSIGDLAYIL